jgi:peroxiredoxin
MRNPLRFALVVPSALLLHLLCATPDVARAQDPDKTPPTAPTGTKPGDATTAPGPAVTGTGRFLIGDAAPDVNLRDQNGRTFHLAVERRTKSWLLAFVRRPQETAEVETAADGLAAMGLGAVIIAPFGHEQQAAWVKAPKLALLTDRASVTARTYGVYDPVTSNPRPGAFLVDKRGRIVWMISGGLPSGSELVRMTREALEAQGELPAGADAEKPK